MATRASGREPGDAAAAGVVRASLDASIRVKTRLRASRSVLAQVARAAGIVEQALRTGHRLFLFGNGGSAADAQHLAAEFVGRFEHDRPALPAQALTANTSILTAVGNDYGFARVFSRQLEAGARPGDVAIALSTSGVSRNVVAGLQTARRLGLRTIALTGQTGGPLQRIAEECVRVPSRETARIQECHILLGHILCELVERGLFDSRRPKQAGRRR